MAEVFLAERTDAPDADRLAIKRILPHLASELDFITMFKEEARIARTLDHPNIVRLHDCGAINGRYYLALEYLDGRSLAEVMCAAKEKQEQLPLGAAVHIMAAISDALHHAHELIIDGRPANLVHRDISPSNVMITFDGRVKLLDFGVAHTAVRHQEKTRTGIVKGKLSYCSPEQIDGLVALDRRSDIFSAGAVFFELLTATRLFKRASEFQTSLAVTAAQVPSPSSIRRDVPAELDSVLLRALSKAPNARFQTAAELRRTFDPLLERYPADLKELMARLFSNGVRSAPSPRTGTHSPLAALPRVDLAAAEGQCGTGTLPLPVGTRCPHATGCALYPKFKIHGLLNVWKLNFCDSDYTKCARHLRMSHSLPVPASLLPNGKDLGL